MSAVNGLAAPKPLSQVVDMLLTVSGRVSASGITLIPRLSRARDLLTMAEGGSTRHTLFQRVTGVGSVFRGARAKLNSLGRSLRLPLPDGAVSLTFVRNCYFLTVRKCREILATIHAKMNAVFLITTIQC